MLISFLLFSCNSSCSKIDKEHESIYQFVNKSSNQIEKKYGLYIFGVGETHYSGINSLDLCFRSTGIYTIEEARLLIVKLSLEVLNELNNDENLKLHSKIYPFLIENINVNIFFKNSSNNSHTIKSVILANKKLSYRITDSEDEFIVIHRETFEEALEIVNQSYNKIS